MLTHGTLGHRDEAARGRVECIPGARAEVIVTQRRLECTDTTVLSVKPCPRHAAGEQLLRFSGIPWTILRPNMFLQELLRQADSIRSQGAFHLPLKTVTVSLLDARDIAEVAAEALTSAGHEGKTYELTGPEALSFDDVARRLSAVLERDVKYVPVAMQQFADSAVDAGMPDWMVEAVCELYATFPGRNNVVRQGVREVLGKPPRRLEEFARDYAAELRGG